MKIAHVGPYSLPMLFAKGGAIERRIVEMARVQAKNGHDVLVYSAEDAIARPVTTATGFEPFLASDVAISAASSSSRRQESI